MRVSHAHRARRYLLALVLAFAALLCAAPAALAVGLTVDSLADTEGGDCSPTSGCTLREAVGLVTEGEEGSEEIGGDVTIDFEVTGTIEIDGELELFLGEGVDSLAITGPGAGELTIDPQGGSRAFAISEGTVTISGLTVENGYVGGFALDGDGGAALYQDGGTATLEDVRFTDNHIESARAGGAIDLEAGDLTIVDSVIDHNTTDTDIEGPGGGINVDSSGSTLTLRGTEVSGNRAEGPGGGIYQDEGNLLVSEGSVITDNVSTYWGGGIAATADGSHTATISESEISGNTATETGGGVFAETGAGGLAVSASTIAANKAEEGGGVMVQEGPTTISTSTIDGNEASNESPAGGGVAINSGSLVLDTATLTANSGGALYGFGGEVQVRASTIAANTDPAGSAAGIGTEQEDALKVRSSIVANNSGASGPADCAGEVVSEGHNILGSNDPGCTWTPGEGDQIGSAPQLGPLADNGGPTLTMAPTAAASIAINHGGDPDPQDQRGRTRPVPVGASFTDVGAVEVQAPVNEAAPSISPSDDLVEGDELSCSPGEWDTDTVTDASYATAWLVGGEQRASGPTYELTAADAGSAVSCEVSVDNGATTATAASAPVELAAGALELAPSARAFGERNVGAGPSAPQTLTLSNAGGTAVTLTGATSSDPEQFPVDASACTAAPLVPGAECTIEARFSPTSPGPQQATVTVHSDGGSPTAELSGTGTTTVLAIAPASFDFGPRRTGTGPSAARAFEVTNAGTGPVTVGSATIAGSAAFSIPAGADGCAGESLAPTATCTVEVVFAPAAAGAATASLSVPSDAPTATAALSGTGTAPAFSASPAALAFGARPLGSGDAAVVVTISNAGNAPMQVGTLAIAGAGAASFRLVPGSDGCSGANLATAASCTVEVGFEPVATGAQLATLTVPGEAPGTVALSGTGTAGQPPAPPAPPSASILAPGSAAATPAGRVPLTLACASPDASPCQVTVTLYAGSTALGSWSGPLAAGPPQRVELPLDSGARRRLGAAGKLAATAVLSVGGGSDSSRPLTLVAPPPPKLVVRSARRAGDAVLFAVACTGYAKRCQGKLSLGPSRGGAVYASGKVTVAKRAVQVRLPLTAAGRRQLEAEPRARLLARASVEDPVYRRTTVTKKRLQLASRPPAS